MKTFIERIDEHIREKGIPFNQIVIPESYLPTYINYAIYQILNKYVEEGDKYLFWPKYYTLEYDSENRLCLKGVLGNGKDIILVYGNTDFYTGSSKDIGHKVSDLDLYDYALILKAFENVRKKIYNEIDEKYGKNISIKERNNIRYESMKNFYISKYYEYGTKIRNLVSLEEEVDKSLELIISYIDYLNESYQKDQEQYRMDKTVFIPYTESDEKLKRSKRTKKTDKDKSRKNEVISMNDRIKVLEGYDYKYFGIAKASNRDKVEYYCYLYEDYDNNSIIVMEPYTGTKYTKVIRLYNTNEISKQDFANICKEYLELSFKESLEKSNITRLGHTTLDSFKINFRVYLQDVNETIVNANIRKLTK